MVSAVQHIRNKLGIDLNQPAITQSRSNLLPGINDLAQAKPSQYLEPIYDAVVGVDESRSREMSGPGPFDKRLGIPGLNNMAGICKQMLERDGTTEKQKKVLRDIINASGKYVKLLTGETPALKKDFTKLGNRHTLIRGEHHQVFEILNSMTINEMGLFRNKTEMTLDPIERPQLFHPPKTTDGRTYCKVQLGSGGFGSARIARNIGNSRYVAVKKIHPEITESTQGLKIIPAFTSNFHTLSQAKQQALAGLSDYVISPIDECKVESKKSKQVEDNLYALARDKALSSHGQYSVAQTLNAAGFTLTTQANGTEVYRLINPEKTNYTFSELGVTTVDGLIKNFNLLRTNFEGSKYFTKLTTQAKNLLNNYSLTYYDGYYTNYLLTSDMQPVIDVSRAKFESPDFGPKDTVFNQKFLNTLAKKMLAALAKLNDIDISHQDIKPDNIVLVQDSAGNIKVKLIDIDLIQPIKGERKIPEAGCIPYMPPEAHMGERDDSISYVPVKGDAYAMGITLREVLGFTFDETDYLSKNLLLASIYEARRKNYDKRACKNNEAKRVAEVKRLDPHGGFIVQDQLPIIAIRNAIPSALSLKDMGDLMLKDHPGKRLTAKDVLNDFPFFDNADNLLTDAEFSDYVRRILRFSVVTPREAVLSANKSNPEENTGMIRLRHSANEKMILNRGENLKGYKGGTLSKREEDIIAQRHAGLQFQAGLRRAGRAAAEVVRPKINQGDKIHRYINKR